MFKIGHNVISPYLLHHLHMISMQLCLEVFGCMTICVFLCLDENMRKVGKKNCIFPQPLGRDDLSPGKKILSLSFLVVSAKPQMVMYKIMKMRKMKGATLNIAFFSGAQEGVQSSSLREISLLSILECDMHTFPYNKIFLKPCPPKITPAILRRNS